MELSQSIYRYDGPSIVKVYSGAALIGQWDAIGVIQTESQANGYHFTNAKTHKVVRVCGTVVIERP